MKINEIENSKVTLLIIYQSKSIQIDLDKVDKEIDLIDVPYIVTNICTFDGKPIDLSSAYRLYIQIPTKTKSMRFLVKHKRVQDKEGNFEVFTSSLDGKEIEQRNAYRLPLGCRCDVETSNGKVGANLKDLSITGICTLGMSLNLKIGQDVRVIFEDTMPAKNQVDPPVKVQMEFSATVVRERTLGKFNEYGLKITMCDPNRLTKYISTKQRLMLDRDKGNR